MQIAHKDSCSHRVRIAALFVPLILPLATADSVYGTIDLKDKVVLANTARWPVTIRVGKTQKKIEAGKASVISPKKLPISLEFWNGARDRATWEELSASTAGIYKFHFLRGRWEVVKHEEKSTAKPTTTGSSTLVRPNFARSTGTRTRVIRSSPRYSIRPRYSGRVPTLSRALGAAFWMYRYIRDEADRELFWDYVVGREIDDAIREEIEDELDKIAVNLPAEELREFERSLDELKGVTDEEWRDLENVTDQDWKDAEELLDENVEPELFNSIKGDLDNLDISDLSEQDLSDLGDAGIADLDTDIDLDNLGDAADLDLGDLGGEIDTMDIGDLGADMQDFDLGDVGIGGGDLGGGYDTDWDTGGLDHGGGMDYGGFDDFGGGGFDDGGIDDFGGGFDDFGGGFDFDF